MSQHQSLILQSLLMTKESTESPETIDISNDSDASQNTVSHFTNDYETMIKSPKGCEFQLLTAKINTQKVVPKREYSKWTIELIGVAKRLFELSFPSHFIAYITNMSMVSVKRLKKQIKPSDSSGEWKCSIEMKKRGPPKKDKTALHEKIREIMNNNPKLSQQTIAERLPEGLKISQSQLSKEIKAIKKSKFMDSIKRKRKSKQKSSANS